MTDKTPSYKKLIQKGQENWSHFQEKRLLRLEQLKREGAGAEKISEGIIEDLLTMTLDWDISQINYQIGHTDILVTDKGIKRLIIETKRPTSLAWNIQAVHKALNQARRYADKQEVKIIAVSDGYLLYVADINNGGLKERLYIDLNQNDFPEELWWLSFHGIYKTRSNYNPKLIEVEPIQISENDLLHPKYNIPARCFAYVGDSTYPKTWKLPYMLQDGNIDQKRLPKAIGSIISNYRGTRVKDVPEEAIFDVLRRLSNAAEKIGKMPHQNPHTSDCYRQLAVILRQSK